MATIAQALQAAFDHLTAGRHDEGRQVLRRILDAAPDNANAHHLLGLLESQDGDAGRGAAGLRRAVALSPGVADYAANLAKALLASDASLDDIATAVRRAARLAPLNPEWPLYGGLLAEKQGDSRRAVAAWRHLLLLQPDYADGWRQAGQAAHQLGQRAVAQAALRRFAIFRPGEVGGWVAAGAAARANDDQPAAAAAFRAALALDPAHLPALSTLGNALKDLGRLEPALAWQDRAIRQTGGDPTMVWNRALTLLLAGRYDEGWPALESRWRAQGFPTRPRPMPAPLWRGEDLNGRHILLYEEQGRGDALQFVRYVPLLAARGARVTLEVGGDLAPLLRDGLDGAERVIVSGAPLPACDYVCPLLSLPLGFRTTLADIPGNIPYLRADAGKTAIWRDRLAGSGPKIGLIWGGNPEFADDRRRSPGLAPLAPLLDLPGTNWFGLQLGGARAALNGRTMPASFTDLGPEITDFADTAAIMANLDVVITSCTAAAHLAGALGRPVWVLLSHAADWRWLTGRDDSPWYPTARLFRQPRPGDWGAVANQVAAVLTPPPAPAV